MAKKVLCIIGGIIMIISILLPTLFLRMSGESYGISYSIEMYYWMYGYAFLRATAEYGGQEVSQTATHFEPDLLGLICITIIIVGAILALAKSSSDSKVPLVGGILGIVGMIAFVAGVYMGSPLTPISGLGRYLSPFLGFYVCILGSILAIVGGALES